jgi:hypothetical protein
MNTVTMKRITIIGDENVGYRIVQEVLAFGATGYTYHLASGKGARGIRPRHAEPSNANIQVIATPELAHQILEHVAKNYFEKYAMIAFLDDVEVVRGEKFGAKAT